MPILGNPHLNRMLNRAIKAYFQRNRPFLTVTIGFEDDVQIHSNMDIHSERIKLLQKAIEQLRSIS